MKREHYIPIDKDRLLEQQIAVNQFSLQDAEGIKKLFTILEHYFHNEGYDFVKNLKYHYAAFDPDKTPEERLEYRDKSNLNVLKSYLRIILDRGNYEEADQSILDEALNSTDLVGLNLKINFDYFKEFKIYIRGQDQYNELVKKNYFWKKEKEFIYYDRVILYLEYKDEAYFKSNNIDLHKIPFSPSTAILKVFKRVPKNDLETIFPNAVPRMSLKDKLLLWVPAIGGGVPLITTKVVPPIKAVVAAYKSGVAVEDEHFNKSLVQGIVALGLIGMYMFRQYKKFVNKKIRFSKLLSDSLYFKNIANNIGVFPALIDAAEDEELKETILAYSFLHQNPKGMTSDELDRKIEEWFMINFGKDIDFDVDDALKKLAEIGIGKCVDGKWYVISINDALTRVDELWDNIFTYNVK